MSTMVKDRKGIGGPKTPEGKRRSSANAVKHGLYAQTEVVVGDLVEQVGVSFDKLLEDFTLQYRPMDVTEAALVRRIATCAWRLMLAEEQQVHMLEEGMIDMGSPSYMAMLRAERHVDMMLHRAIAALSKKRRLEEYDKARNELPPPHRGRVFPMEDILNAAGIPTPPPANRPYQEVCEKVDRFNNARRAISDIRPAPAPRAHRR